ncbi:MAG: hypothetical protein ACREP9_22365 [Candidatus Dormibacteraceae bacterium]
MPDIGAILTQKKGPFPVWVYGLGVFGLTWWYISHQKAKQASGGSSGGGTPGQFTSSQSTKYTDPKTGQQIDTAYSAQGGGYGGAYGSPAQFVTAAGPMPFSGGDVYVNYPGQPTAPPPPPPPPEHHHPPPNRDPDWGHWVTLQGGDTVDSVTQRLLGDASLSSKVWNDPVNKILHDARGGDPTNTKAGDVLWVFDGWRPGWVAPADFVPYPMVKPPPPEYDTGSGGQWHQQPNGQTQWLSQGADGNGQQTVQLTPTQWNPAA